MNNKLHLPESVWPGKNYSACDDFRLNAWDLVAVTLALVSRIWLLHHPEAGLSTRAALALSPLAPSLLYVRNIACWIRGMDEMQRRIQLEACLCGTIGTIFLATALSLLASNHIQLPLFQHGLGWEGTFASLMAFYILGNVIANRRYQ